jgi:hypothetical protein
MSSLKKNSRTLLIYFWNLWRHDECRHKKKYRNRHFFDINTYDGRKISNVKGYCTVLYIQYCFEPRALSTAVLWLGPTICEIMWSLEVIPELAPRVKANLLRDVPQTPTKPNLLRTHSAISVVWNHAPGYVEHSCLRLFHLCGSSRYLFRS